MRNEKKRSGKATAWIIVLTIILGMASVLPMSAAAGTTIVSIPDDASAKTGETVTVPINITNVTDLGAATIWLLYNSSVVNVESVSDGDLGSITPGINNTAGVTKMSWFTTTGKTGDFVFAYVTLMAVGSADETSLLDLDIKKLVDTDNNPIAHEGDDGMFTVEAGPAPLVADAGGPYSGLVDQAITFTGSATGGTSPYSYAWDLDYDGEYDDATDATASHTWSIADTYTIGLQVTDSATPANVSTDTATVVVSEIVGALVSIPDASANTGETVTVPINITNVTDLGAATIWLLYNSSVVNVESVSDGDLGSITPGINNTAGVTKMSWFTTTGKTGDFVFAYVTLKAVGSADETSTLDLDIKKLVDIDNNPIEHTVDDGVFTVKPPIPVKVVINEFVAEPSVIQTSEWIELYNPTGSDADLTGWTIEDNTGSTYGTGTGDTPLDGKTVPANGYLVLNKTAGDFGFALNNGGDVIILKNATGEVDRVEYGDGAGIPEPTEDNAPAPGPDNSTGRYPDGVDTDVDIDDFIVFTTPTPGEPNPEDTIAPTTTVTAPEMPAEPSPIPSGHALNWTNKTVMLSFHRVDNGGDTVSGVNYTAYKIGTALHVYEYGDEDFTVNVTAQGTTTVGYLSVDKAGNPEDLKSLTVKIDKTNPVITSVTLDKYENVTANESINVTVEATDNVGVVNVTADGIPLTIVTGTPQAGKWNGTITASAEPGLHNVTVIAKDAADNTAMNDTVQYEVEVPITILEYYCCLDDDCEHVSTTELLTAADDWSTGKIVNDFDRPINTTELLQLAEWWIAGEIS